MFRLPYLPKPASIVKDASYADYITSLDAIDYPKVLLGYSQDGAYPIYGYRIGAFDGTKKIIGIQGCIHGNEWIGAYSVREFAKKLNVDYNDTNAWIIQKIKATYDFLIIPMLNPWGFVNGSRDNSRAVDVNRNFDVHWDLGETSGSEPFSEAETQISRDFFFASQKDNLRMFLDIHTWGSQLNCGGYYGNPDDVKWAPFWRDWKMTCIGTAKIPLSYYQAGDPLAKSSGYGATGTLYARWKMGMAEGRNDATDPCFASSLEGYGNSVAVVHYHQNAMLLACLYSYLWEKEKQKSFPIEKLVIS